MNINKNLITPLLILSLIIVLNLIAVKIIFDNASRLYSDLTVAQKQQNSLQSKLTSLQNVSPEVSSNSNDVLAALPSVNPVLTATGNMQSYAAQEGLTLSAILSSASIIPSVDTNSSSISFNADGSYSALETFVTKLSHAAPLTHFSSIKIKKQSENDYQLTGSVLTFWASLPTTLPAVDDPVTKLTTDEESKLKDILALDKPLVINTTTASTSGTIGKANPFQ